MARLLLVLMITLNGWSTPAYCLYNLGALWRASNGALPTVTSVSPAVGRAGTSITITGTGFRSGVTATVAGAACTSPNFFSATSMTCVVPASTTVSQATVAVTNTDTTSGSLANAFLQVGAPALWLNAGEGVTSSSNLVSPWADQSGSNNATQGTGANQPTYVASESTMGSRPFIRFGGSHRLNILTSTYQNASAGSWVLAGRTTSKSTQQSIVGFSSASSSTASRSLKLRSRKCLAMSVRRGPETSHSVDVG